MSGEIAKEGLTVRVIFQQRPTGSEEVKPGDVQGKSIPGRETSTCKGPVVEVGLECLRNNRQPGMAGEQWGAREVGDEATRC